MIKVYLAQHGETDGDVPISSQTTDRSGKAHNAAYATQTARALRLAVIAHTGREQ